MRRVWMWGAVALVAVAAAIGVVATSRRDRHDVPGVSASRSGPGLGDGVGAEGEAGDPDLPGDTSEQRREVRDCVERWNGGTTQDDLAAASWQREEGRLFVAVIPDADTGGCRALVYSPARQLTRPLRYDGVRRAYVEDPDGASPPVAPNARLTVDGGLAVLEEAVATD